MGRTHCCNGCGARHLPTRPLLHFQCLIVGNRGREAYSSGASTAVPASISLMADRSSAASGRGVPASVSRRGVCELSRVQMRGKDIRASTSFPGVHTQPSPRASRGRASRMRRPSARSAWPSIQRLGHYASVLLLVSSWQPQSARSGRSPFTSLTEEALVGFRGGEVESGVQG